MSPLLWEEGGGGGGLYFVDSRDIAQMLTAVVIFIACVKWFVSSSPVVLELTHTFPFISRSCPRRKRACSKKQRAHSGRFLNKPAIMLSAYSSLSLGGVGLFSSLSIATARACRRPRSACVASGVIFHSVSSLSPAARKLHGSATAWQTGAKKKPGAGGGGGGGAAAPVAEEKVDLTKVVPVNLKKDGVDPPLQAESEYPPWLFALLEDKPILADHLQKGLAHVPDSELKSVIRQINRKRIKDGNDLRRKS